MVSLQSALTLIAIPYTVYFDSLTYKITVGDTPGGVEVLSGKYITALFMTALCTLLPLPAGDAAVLAVNPVPLDGRIIVLDPGHGGRDHGYCRQNSVCERDIDLEITEKIAALLKNSGASVYMTRSEGSRLLPWRVGQSETSLDRRISMSREKKADIFVSIHCNASLKPHRTGAMVFYRDNSDAGRRLADLIQREIVKIPENGKRTDKPGNYYLLNKIPVPAVVIESCYLSHWKDKENILNPEYQQKFASAVFSGIEKYFSSQIAPDIKKAVREASSGHTAPEKYSGDAGGRFLRAPEEMPGGMKIASIEVKDSQARIDLKTAGEGLSLGGEEEYLALYALVNNVFKVPEIQSTLITVNGASAETLAGHMDISSPITRQNPVCAKIPLGTKEEKKAQVAIVIDDFGQYKPEGLEEILSLDIPVTCAVMPNMENTEKHAEEASSLGQEVIVHLPLEPVRGRKKWLGPGAITVGMPEDQIKALAVKDFESVHWKR